jgi:hypothetical protein
MRRRVLIVAGSYAPTMIADMHRARQLAWELPKLGWDVEILCPDASYQPPSCVDENSSAFFSPSTIVHYIPLFHPAVFSALGLGNIGWRAFVPMLQAGRQLLRERRFDIVYISTTQFPLFLLGPAWRRRFGVPYVLDFHDPCFNESASHPVWARPSLKHTIANWLSKYVESRSVIAAAGIISVSPAYVEILHRRYEEKKPAWLDGDRVAVIPFAALPHDLEEASEGMAYHGADSAWPVRIVYVGAGGPIMLRSLSVLCKALSHLRIQNPELVKRIRIELFGTMLGWPEGAPRHLSDLACELGLADVILEYPSRVSYRRSLELLLGSDGALILGVDEAGYMPSKLFSYALSGKPLLASLRRDGPAFSQFRDRPGLGHALWFDKSSAMPAADAAKVLNAFLKEVIARRTFNRRAMLEPFLAPAMARRHVELFRACLQSSKHVTYG